MVLTHKQEVLEHIGETSSSIYDKAYQQGRADAIEEFDRICEEARGHKFGICDADFVIDVIKAKVKEQLKEQKNE